MLVSQKIKLLTQFVAWVEDHIDGDEKGEAQIFLERLFRAFGWPGLKEAGATCELRIKNDAGGTSFADLVWKPVVLVEMKKDGADLSKHYRQAFDYWTRLVPGRPRYVILCNFREFWIYDFETQMDTPVDKVKLVELPDRFAALAFMFPGEEKPIFGNHQEIVTRQAADKLAECFTSLVDRTSNRDASQLFILQMLMALFAQDIGLLEKHFVTQLLADCKTAASAYDALGSLFEAMNNSKGIDGGRYKGVPYFNGGLFKSPSKIELNIKELNLLRDAASFNWSRVRPEIFGTLFEHSLSAGDRGALGAHYTNSADIMKIVTPTIIDPWREQIESAKTLSKLRELLVRLQNFTVLDAACGSGNFLYISYREVKRLEARLYERMADEYKSVNKDQRPFGFVTVRNFYGLDINRTAVEIARVTMMLAHKLAIDELHITENALPLDNLDDNIKVADALVDDKGQKTIWPRTDVVIGNPPFLGAKKLKPMRGKRYADLVRQAYPEVPGMADYCVYWIRKTHDELPFCTIDNPFSGRAGLVGTQNIRNSQHRVGGLDYVCSNGSIVEAVDNQPWSGEANVSVSIVNWVKTQSEELLPRHKRLWFKSDVNFKKIRKCVSGKTKTNNFELDSITIPFIGPTLSEKTDTTRAVDLYCNTSPQKAFQGVTPGHAAFILNPGERDTFIKKDMASEDVIFPYLIGSELLTGTGKPKRYLIDFQPRTLPEAATYGALYKRIEKEVLTTRIAKVEDDKGEAGSHHKSFLKRWWRLSWERSEMIREIEKLRGRYIVCSRVTKRPIFVFIDSSIRPGDRLQTFMFDDDYSFGILQSNLHWLWFVARCPKQLERFIYTTDDVYNTFPWPQTPTKSQVEEVAAASRNLRAVRTKLANPVSGGLRGLYKTLEFPGDNPLKDAQSRLDNAVLITYGFSRKQDELANLLELNCDIALRLKNGVPVVSPGMPPSFAKLEALISKDRMGD